MNLNERISYIKGLAAGLQLDQNKGEIKFFNEVLDLAHDLVLEINELNTKSEELYNRIDALEDDFEDFQDDIYDSDFDDDLSFLDDKDNDEEDFDADADFYEVTCSSCNETICISEDVLLGGEIECPICGEQLEFDFSDLEKDKDKDSEPPNSETRG